jgi:beta-lactamase superfamily II metal-dependent hydrolase
MVKTYTDVHVLNVGRGSCTVVESPSGRASMIDINDGGKLREEEYGAIRQRSFIELLAGTEIKKEEALLVDPIDWFLTNVGPYMWRFILSHPDKDHMSGIRRLFSGGSGISLTVGWDYDHTRTRTEADYPNNSAGWLDWQWYMGFHKGYMWDGVTWPQRIHPLRADAGNYWTDDSIEIVSPTPALIQDCDDADVYNDSSYVVRVGHGPTSHVLIPGDAESKAWNDMVAANVPLRANVLVAAHHGRDSGYHEEALDLIRPEIVIISSDDIPAKEDAIAKYKKRATVFSTREYGTLTVRMHDGGDLEVIDGNGTVLASLSDMAAA